MGNGGTVGAVGEQLQEPAGKSMLQQLGDTALQEQQPVQSAALRPAWAAWLACLLSQPCTLGPLCHELREPAGSMQGSLCSGVAFWYTATCLAWRSHKLVSGLHASKIQLTV